MKAPRIPRAGARGPRDEPGPERGDANRRGGLIRASGRLFREKGYEATTVRDIADAAGMRSGSPFYHFKSKQEMLKVVMLEGIRDAQLRLEAAACAKGTPRARLRAMVRAHLAAILGPGADYVPVLLYDWRALPWDMRVEVVEARDRYEAVWDALLGELKRAGLIRDAGSLTRLLFLGSLNWIVQWYRPGGKCSVDEIAARAADFILGARARSPARGKAGRFLLE